MEYVGILLAMFPVVALKLGREGVIIYTRKNGMGAYKHFPPPRIVEEGNTSGAGDTFVGTLVSEMSRRKVGLADLDVDNQVFVECVQNAVEASVQSVECLEHAISRKLQPFE
jgi:sugar/nucleoside kinase (ribokinase family)